jgi:type VII secretion protein EccB
MALRQDRPDAYQLTRERVASALVVRDSDPPQPPFRGAAGATLASVLIAAIAIGAVALWARFTGGGGEEWRDPGAVIIEAETGARYLWREPLLHPLANYTSAQLLLGEPAPPAVTVPRAALAGVPRGRPLGIPGAPESLPAAGDLIGGAWAVCSTVGAGGRTRAVLVAGGGPAGRPVGGVGLADRALLVRDPSGDQYLVWRERRYRIRDPEVVLPALGWAGAPSTPVAEALLDALPEGTDLARIDVPDLGEPAPAVPGARSGEVFVVATRGGEPQYAVALPDGLALLTPVQADLLLTDPRVGSALARGEPAPMSPAQFAALPRLDPDTVAGAGWPPTAPPLARPADAAVVCAVVPDGAAVAAVSVDATPPSPAAAATAGRAAGDAPAVQVWVEPGRAVLVSDGETVHVVTDLGTRHAVGPAALAPLGYDEVAPVSMPGRVVGLIPPGPVLELERASGDAGDAGSGGT